MDQKTRGLCAFNGRTYTRTSKTELMMEYHKIWDSRNKVIGLIRNGSFPGGSYKSERITPWKMEWWTDRSYVGSYIFNIAEDLEGAPTNTAIDITEEEALKIISWWKDPSSFPTAIIKGRRSPREDPYAIPGLPEDWVDPPISSILQY